MATYTDSNGDAVALGAQVSLYNYDAYGNLKHGAGDDQPFLYTGRRYDAETGLYYYRARYYSSELGRFLQTDPIGYEDNMNLYGYTNNDPVNKVDPFGLAACGKDEDNCVQVENVAFRFNKGTNKMKTALEKAVKSGALKGKLTTSDGSNVDVNVSKMAKNTASSTRKGATAKARFTRDKSQSNTYNLHVDTSKFNGDIFDQGTAVHEGNHLSDAMSGKNIWGDREAHAQSEIDAWGAEIKFFENANMTSQEAALYQQLAPKMGEARIEYRRDLMNARITGNVPRVSVPSLPPMPLYRGQ